MPANRRPHTHSQSATAIKNQVPIRTFGSWANELPGSVQADLVAHCGESSEGFHLFSLMAAEGSP